MDDWWSSLDEVSSSLTADVNSLTNSIWKAADNISETIIASAKEAQNEMECEQDKMTGVVGSDSTISDSPIEVVLPWETSNEALAILSESLMEEILKISSHSCNFTCLPKSVALCAEPFDFPPYVAVALKTLEVDANLALMHAKVAPKMAEETFWRNYYLRTRFLRARVGIEGEEVRMAVGSIAWGDVFDYEELPLPPLPSVPIMNNISSSSTDYSCGKQPQQEEEGEERTCSPSTVQPPLESDTEDAAYTEASIIIEDSEESAHTRPPLVPSAAGTSTATNHTSVVNLKDSEASCVDSECTSTSGGVGEYADHAKKSEGGYGGMRVPEPFPIPSAPSSQSSLPDDGDFSITGSSILNASSGFRGVQGQGQVSCSSLGDDSDYINSRLEVVEGLDLQGMDVDVDDLDDRSDVEDQFCVIDKKNSS